MAIRKGVVFSPILAMQRMTLASKSFAAGSLRKAQAPNIMNSVEYETNKDS